MNQKKNYLTTPKESGFTLVEVIIAVVILSFAIFATLRVITASLNSITRQGQRVKALHLAQAHLAKLEAESFSKVVPESPTVSSDLYNYVINRFGYQIVGDGDTEYVDDGEIVVYVYDAQQKEWENINYACTDNETVDDKPQIQISGHKGKTIRIDYKYYHLVEEGGTIPSSDGEGLNERTIKLITSVGDTNGNGTPEEKSDILGDDLTDNVLLSPSDYESFDPQTGKLTFIETKQGNSVWIYYLPQKTTDSDGDGYDDPGDKSILGVVEGSFCNPDGSLANQITNTKKLTVTEFWKQGKDVQSTTQETYITR